MRGFWGDLIVDSDEESGSGGDQASGGVESQDSNKPLRVQAGAPKWFKPVPQVHQIDSKTGKLSFSSPAASQLDAFNLKADSNHAKDPGSILAARGEAAAQKLEDAKM